MPLEPLHKASVEPKPTTNDPTMNTQPAILDSPTPWNDPPKVIDRSFEENLESERTAAVSRVNERAAKQKETHLKIAQLTKAVTTAEQALVEFETKKAFFVQRKQQLISNLPTFWSQRKGDLSTQMNFDPLLAIVESHGTLLAIQDALLDAPKVHKELLARLDTAKRALADHNHTLK
jgi:hypothetical protein